LKKSRTGFSRWRKKLSLFRIERVVDRALGGGHRRIPWCQMNPTLSRFRSRWHPPVQMIARQWPGNPLGARAMYLGSSQYRIHGTNDPSTIGKFVSSGCVRLMNEDVTDLYSTWRSHLWAMDSIVLDDAWR
jgi:L,D-transpeptidase catalytic domain